jgi:hypothetical protein
MTDIVDRINNRIHDAPMPTEHLLDEAAEEITRLRAALEKIACFDDLGANKRLTSSGSYGSFDEPGSVRIAREALRYS